MFNWGKKCTKTTPPPSRVFEPGLAKLEPPCTPLTTPIPILEQRTLDHDLVRDKVMFRPGVETSLLTGIKEGTGDMTSAHISRLHQLDMKLPAVRRTQPITKRPKFL